MRTQHLHNSQKLKKDILHKREELYILQINY